MTLLSILVGTLVAGVGSVWLAALLAYALLSRFTQHLLSLAAGALLATAFMRLLPEAFAQSASAGVSAQALFSVLLLGLVFFFLLDKAELWHHGHEHHQAEPHAQRPSHAHPESDHGHGHAHASHAHATHEHHHHAHGGGWAVLLGDSVHAFGDGIQLQFHDSCEIAIHYGLEMSFEKVGHDDPFDGWKDGLSIHKYILALFQFL